MNSDKFIKKYFEECRKVALQSTFKKCHTGCVVVYKNKIISTGYNMTKTHPLQKKYNKERFEGDSPHYIHAEISALASLINDSDIDWKRVYIFIARLDGNDQTKFRFSRPCKSCMKIIKTLDIRHVYYTTDDGYCCEYVDGDIITVIKS